MTGSAPYRSIDKWVIELNEALSHTSASQHLVNDNSPINLLHDAVVENLSLYREGNIFWYIKPGHPKRVYPIFTGNTTLAEEYLFIANQIGRGVAVFGVRKSVTEALLKKGLGKSRLQDESFLVKSDFAPLDYAGGSHRSVRRSLNRSQSVLTTTVHKTSASFSEYVTLDKTWQAQRKSRHPTMHSRDSVSWIGKNISRIADCGITPVTVEHRVLGELVSYQLFTRVCKTTIICHFRKYDVDKSESHFLYQEMRGAFNHFGDVIMDDGNGGASDFNRSSDLLAQKTRYSYATLPIYLVWH